MATAGAHERNARHDEDEKGRNQTNTDRRCPRPVALHDTSPDHAAELADCRNDLVEAENALAWLVEQPPSWSTAAFGLSDEDLRNMARICEVRVETPGALTERDISKLELSDGEIEAYEAARQEVERETGRIGAEAYEAAYDAPPDGAEVSLLVLMDSKRDGDHAITKRIAEERAGLRDPPEDTRLLSPYERYFRALVSRGDRLEEALGATIGEERAHEIRLAGRGWPGGVGMHYRGCEQPPE